MSWAVAGVLWFSVSKSAPRVTTRLNLDAGIARDLDIVSSVAAGHEVVEARRVVGGAGVAHGQQVAVLVVERELLILAVEALEAIVATLALVEVERVDGGGWAGTAGPTPILMLWNEFTNALGPALNDTSSGSAPPGEGVVVLDADGRRSTIILGYPPARFP